MKRSHSVALVLMGVSALALTACEEEKIEAAIYENVQQCLDDNKVAPDQCEAHFLKAQQQHAKVAPKYTAKTDCEADFGRGNCENSPYRTSSGGGVFMPIMMGYMMGSMLRGGRGVATQPLYRSADDGKSFRTATNKSVGGQTGLTKVAKSSTARPKTNLRTSKRGGFGARARAGGMRIGG